MQGKSLHFLKRNGICDGRIRNNAHLKLASWAGRANGPAVITSKAGYRYCDGFVQTVGGHLYRMFDPLDVAV